MALTDDFVLNVRQISQYPTAEATSDADRWLTQVGGVGGQYKAMIPSIAVGTALEMGGFLKLAPGDGLAWNGARLIWQDGWFQFSEPVVAPLINAGDITRDGERVATLLELETLFAIPKVDSFNGRTGIVQLNEDDIRRAGGTPSNNPHFTGTVLVPTVWDFRSNDQHAASTAWVQGVLAALLCSGSVVTSVNGRGGAVVLGPDDITAAASVPGVYARASNAPLGDSSTRIATTFFVDETAQYIVTTLRDEIQNAASQQLVGYAPLNSPSFTGVPTAPTASPGSSTGQLATTAFVQAAVTAATTGVSSFNTRTGAVTLVTADITAAGGAPLASPALSGTPTAPTAAPGDNTTKVATTAFVHAAVAAIAAGVTTFNGRSGAVTLITADITGAGGAALASPVFTGTPAGPTAAPGTNTTQLATTAYVQAALGSVTAGVSSFNARTGAVTLQPNDVSAAGGALVNSPTLTGTPAAPTAAPGTSTTQIATTAYVMAALTASGVASFNGRTGAVSLVSADVSGAGGALLASPALSGTPTAPNPAPGTNNTQIATTSFVMSALGGSIVSTFNGRSGAVTLATGDITGAGGAPLSSPAFTGTPSAPTPAPGNSSTLLATTAFVQAALAGGVTAFNGRTGSVTLAGADISAAGGALLAGPAFTGTPTAPTATTGTATNQLATCQFVLNELGTLGGVTTFNGRAGNITLTSADLTSAGGALLASPTFTGSPSAPTPAPGNSSTLIATTAFVAAAIAATPTLTQSDTAPTVPGNALWFDSVGGQLYVQYIDPSTSAKSWVIANSPQPSPAPPPASGALVLINKTTISASVAQVDVFADFTAYDVLQIFIYDVVSATEGILYMRLSFDGSTFDAGASAYVNSSSTAIGNNTGGASGATATGMAISNYVNAFPAYPQFAASKLRLGVVGNAPPSAISEANGRSATTGFGFGQFTGSQYFGSLFTAAVKGLRFTTTFNLTRGTIYVYGVVK